MAWPNRCQITRQASGASCVSVPVRKRCGLNGGGPPRNLIRRPARGRLGWHRGFRLVRRNAMAIQRRRQAWPKQRAGESPTAAPVLVHRADAVRLTPRAVVDVALVLAIDSSGSISEERLMLQIQGYLDALRHPLFIEAVRGGPNGRIGLTFVEWTDARRQEQVVGWRVIEQSADAYAFA